MAITRTADTDDDGTGTTGRVRDAAWKTEFYNQIDAADAAGLVSPAFTGTPTAPTAALGTNTTQLATTAFVTRVGWSVATARTDTGAVNNWAAPLVGNTLIPWNGAADATFSGLAGGVAGQIAIVQNITAAKVAYFLHASGLSSAANQFTNDATSGPTPIAPGGALGYLHNGTTWQLFFQEQGAWIAYTPTWVGSVTNPVIGNGVLLGRYRLSGRTVLTDIHLIPGSTTTYGSGTYTFALPPLAAADTNGQTGPVFLYHAGAAFGGAVLMSSTTALSVWASGGGQQSPTVPFTMANADQVRIGLTYITS